MRMSQLFGRTLREAPAGVETKSHQLLLRAGFIRPLAAGVFSYLHLGQRTLQKMEAIIREEMDKLGQEIKMPVVHPAALWQEAGRWRKIDEEISRFRAKNGRDMVLAAAYEEIAASLARQEIHSYRQLPQTVYHMQTKWRDDPRPRAGLIRAREFITLDSYSLDADEAGLDKQYQAHYEAYLRIFDRFALPVTLIEAGAGMAGSSLWREFIYLTPAGEDSVLCCPQCAYKANQQAAVFAKPAVAGEAMRPMEKVATPGCQTIADLARFLNVPPAKTAKAVFLTAARIEGQAEREQLIFALVRGDMKLNEMKLANVVGAVKLRPSTGAEIRAAGAEPGYASPVGLDDVLVVVDDAIPDSPNLVAGANEVGYHLKNVNLGRDYQADVVADIALAEAGAACRQCGAPLAAGRGVTVGHIAKLGATGREALAVTFLDANGRPRPALMGSYHLAVTRALACLAEEHRDEHGLVWPASVAPYHVHLIALRGGEETAGALYAELREAGVEVLYDDRREAPGVKFNDADLIGLPLRLTVSKRSLQNGGVELKRRRETERQIVPLASVITYAQNLLQA